MLISCKRKWINNPSPYYNYQWPNTGKCPYIYVFSLLLTSDLSLSKHIEGACTNAKKILGLLYCRFYQHADQDTLRQLYISIVQPHMEYAAPVWDPHLRKIKIYLKAHRHLCVKWSQENGTKDMMSFWIWLTCPLLQTEGCTLNYVPCTKLCTTCHIFHLILLCLKSLDYTKHSFHLVPALCTY